MKTDAKVIESSEWITLDPDEEVVKWGHPSIFMYLVYYIAGGATILAGLILPFVSSFGYLPSAAIILFGILLIVLEHYRRVSVFYVLTTERCIKKTGIFSHNIDKIHYSEIQKTNKENPIIGRILGFGNVCFVTASPDMSDIDMKYIPSPNEVTSEYSKRKE